MLQTKLRRYRPLGEPNTDRRVAHSSKEDRNDLFEGATSRPKAGNDAPAQAIELHAFSLIISPLSRRGFGQWCPSGVGGA